MNLFDKLSNAPFRWLLIVFALNIFGMVALYSISQGTANFSFSSRFVKFLLWFIPAFGAFVFLLTTQKNSSIGRLANYILPISAPSPKIEKSLGFNSIQPLGSLFEQSLMLTLDAIVLVLMEELEIANNSMFQIHANLE